jgi:hypothetical protein
VDVSEYPCWVRRVTRQSWDKRPDWERPGTVLRTLQNKKGFPRERRRKGKRPSFVRLGRELEDTSMRTDPGEGRMGPR